jgi:hypothetical protein
MPATQLVNQLGELISVAEYGPYLLWLLISLGRCFDSISSLDFPFLRILSLASLPSCSQQKPGVRNILFEECVVLMSSRTGGKHQESESEAVDSFISWPARTNRNLYWKL